MHKPNIRDNAFQRNNDTCMIKEIFLTSFGASQHEMQLKQKKKKAISVEKTQ